jgi:hypothetical protein
MEDDNEVEHRAIEALCEPAPEQEPNPEPLAQILRGERLLSKSLRLILAELIDPKLARGSLLNVKLVPKVTGARRKAEQRFAKNEPIIRAMVAEFRARAATVESAAGAVADKLSISERWAIKKWKEAERGAPWFYGRRDIFAEMRSDIANFIANIESDPTIQTAFLDAIAKALEQKKFAQPSEENRS